MSDQHFNEFIKIAKKLNELYITPLLMGSVGLELVTGEDWQAGNIDIHVPGDERGWEVPPEKAIDHWQEIMNMMKNMGYILIDLHEHAFSKDEVLVEFGIIDTLPSFAGVSLEDLEVYQSNGVTYYLLTPVQYLSVYKASSKDSYRANQNNNKDLEKIDYLEKLIHIC